MGEEDCRNSGDGIACDLEDQSTSGRGGRVADTETFQNGAVGEKRSYGGGEGLEGVVGLVREIVVGNGVWITGGQKGVEDRLCDGDLGFVLWGSRGRC